MSRYIPVHHTDEWMNTPTRSKPIQVYEDPDSSQSAAGPSTALVSVPNEPPIDLTQDGQPKVKERRTFRLLLPKAGYHEGPVGDIVRATWGLDPWRNKNDDKDEEQSESDSDQSALKAYSELYYNGRQADSDEDNEEELEVVLTAGPNALRARKVEYVVAIPQYPKTHRSGFAYVIDCNADKVPCELDVQYSFASSGIKGSTSTHSELLGGIACKKTTLRCNGIKHCQYLHYELANFNHTEVTEQWWNRVHEKRLDRWDQGEPDPAKSNAARMYFAIRELYDNGTICEQFQVGRCKLVCRQFQSPSTVTKTREFFICCDSYNSQLKGPAKTAHFFQKVHSWQNIEYSYISQFFSRDEPQPTRNTWCCDIAQADSRRPTCAFSHAGHGAGAMKQSGCIVTFYKIVPIDFAKMPYVIWLSVGEHVHPPPPPVRPVQSYSAELQKLIRYTLNDTLTPTRFLQSFALKDWLQSHGVEDLSELHGSLGNTDAIAREIKRQQLLYYPHGTQLNGVKLQWIVEQKDPGARYIQGLWWTDTEFMVLLFHPESAFLMHQFTSIEVDMSFKRVQGSDMNELLLGKYDTERTSMIPIARAIVQGESVEIYENFFRRAFERIHEITNKHIAWDHIHGEGVKAVVADMNLMQARGLGQYLASIDYLNRPWKEHLEHVIIYCVVHWNRNLFQAAGTHKDSADPIHRRMQALREITSKEAWDKEIEALKGHPNPAVAAWAKQKNFRIVRCGLAPAYSRMDKAMWEAIRCHTNLIESTGSLSNTRGRKLPIMTAIKEGRDTDRKLLATIANIDWTGIQFTWRSRNDHTREIRSILRAQSARKKRITYSAKKQAADQAEAAVADEPQPKAAVEEAQPKAKKQRSTTDLREGLPATPTTRRATSSAIPSPSKGTQKAIPSVSEPTVDDIERRNKALEEQTRILRERLELEKEMRAYGLSSQ
ncbi:unnamed protein product [Zymoseptoria tritici ST99CH_1E4]|uniref:Uncharacterized protein n=1 Tax=Zymoseptoria tritici ST99CH_1E4 TaxID=1276532 RepID=A0A2H1G5Z6_ZYMTR|nr:unnamed protein product [Zymoseptoria tritici ST99CH_1E4]SMR41986.1 unnamed protein product [Zymoseptoria tritici ST99CH_1E4]SMR48246.1 unnamed protein product [Zymoseptoria tritici ST99CH_1E4]SMR48992.1 unnamed protein product [Zymoseptoria tritici ST99CH_1E4]